MYGKICHKKDNKLNTVLRPQTFYSYYHECSFWIYLISDNTHQKIWCSNMWQWIACIYKKGFQKKEMGDWVSYVLLKADFVTKIQIERRPLSANGITFCLSSRPTVQHLFALWSMHPVLVNRWFKKKTINKIGMNGDCRVMHYISVIDSIFNAKCDT